jgi:putative membrane protein
MVTAFSISCAFLICYLVYHAQVGSLPFPGKGLIRMVYLSILATHTALAAAVPVLAILTLRCGLTARVGAQRRLAKWTLPIWLYVSVTSVVVYLMLYHL